MDKVLGVAADAAALAGSALSPCGSSPSAPAANAWEADCMSCDPFEGDYGGSCDGDGVLSDKMVTARKGGECHTCAGEIEPGTRVRRRAEVYDGEFMRFGWCEPCCRAMAAYDASAGSPDEDAYEKRIALGQERRAAIAKAEGRHD